MIKWFRWCDATRSNLLWGKFCGTHFNGLSLCFDSVLGGCKISALGWRDGERERGGKEGGLSFMSSSSTRLIRAQLTIEKGSNGTLSIVNEPKLLLNTWEVFITSDFLVRMIFYLPQTNFPKYYNCRHILSGGLAEAGGSRKKQRVQ